MDDTSKQEILEAINIFATHVEERFDKLENRMGTMESRMGTMESRMGKIEATVTTLVTTDHFDEKMADMRGDLVVLLRKEDNKLGALIAELIRSNVLTQDAAVKILSMEPFPQMR